MRRRKNIKIFFLLVIIMSITISGSGCTNNQSSMEEVPDIINVVLKDKDNVEIMKNNGWIELQSITRINVQFEGEVDYIFFYFIPTGTETFTQRKLIGVLSAYDNDSSGEKGFGVENNTAEYTWNVPNESFMGHLGIELISGTVGRYESSIVNIINDDNL
ncbi:hypothetical protein [Anaerovorax odorimutans]|uniref:hypothetical protein n=1 Tax=Anaerovorax odorimutans TaxID=109327 RepID=UPI00040DEB16|nr:hypothetical protein [Anaerovorax odorimutans]